MKISRDKINHISSLLIKDFSKRDELDYKVDLNDLRLEKQDHDDTHRSGSLKTQHLEERIELWKQKAGAICTECEMEVSALHTDDKIKPLHDELQSKQDQLNEITTKINKLKHQIIECFLIFKFFLKFIQTNSIFATTGQKI